LEIGKLKVEGDGSNMISLALGTSWLYLGPNRVLAVASWYWFSGNADFQPCRCGAAFVGSSLSTAGWHVRPSRAACLFRQGI